MAKTEILKAANHSKRCLFKIASDISQKKYHLTCAHKYQPYRTSGLRPIIRTNFISAKNSNSLKNVFIKFQMFWSMLEVYIMRLFKVPKTTINFQKKKIPKKIRCYGEKTVKNNGFS